MLSPQEREVNLRKIEQVTGLTYSTYQREVLLYSKGCVVMAGAGSGKTSVLAGRAAMYYLEHGRVNDLLLATFSKKAAGELNDRVKGILSKLGGNSPTAVCEARTLHSLFYRVLTNLGYAFDIISDLDERDIIRDIIKAEHITVKSEVVGLGERDESLRVLAEAYNYASNKLMRLKDVYELQELSRYLNLDGFIKLGSELDHNKLIQHRYTLEDLQRVLARVLLTNKNGERKYIHSLYDKFIIDEFQDTSPVQARILKVMTHGKEQVNFIGDIEQSIYGFRGASPDILAGIDQTYNIKRFDLPVNYRSTRAVVDKANILTQYNSYNINRAPMETIDGVAEGKVESVKLSNSEVYWAICDYIKDKRKDSSATVCVETRINIQNILTHLLLLSKGIKHSYSGEIHLNKSLKAEMNIIAMLADRDVMDEGRTLYNITSLTVHKAHILSELWFDQEVGIYDFIKRIFAGEGDPDYAPVLLKKIENQIGSLFEIRSILGMFKRVLEVPNEYGRLAKVFELYEEKQDKGLFKNNNYKRLFQEKKSVILGLLQEWGSLAKLAELFDDLNNKSLPAGETGYKVVVQTIHQSKGLEYDYVVRAFCDGYNQPNLARLEKLKGKGFSIGTIRAEVEEERRLEYVALTRAKKECRYFVSDNFAEISPFVFEIFGKTDSQYYRNMADLWQGLNK